MEEKLNWKEFSAVDKSKWMAAAEKALKGKSYSEYLEWISREGAVFQSYKDISDLPSDDSLPGTFPWNRGIKTENNEWICSDVFKSNDELNNKYILQCLSEGVNGLNLLFSGQDHPRLNTLLKDVLIEIIDLQIHSSKNPLSTTNELIALINDRGLSTVGFKAAVLSEIEMMDEILKSSHTSIDAKSLIRTAHVDLRDYQNQGASNALELALALSIGHEILVSMLNDGITIDQAGALFQFSFGIGPNYLEEIAKLRSIRALWNQVISEYKPQHRCSSCIHIHAENALWNQSVNDAHNNLLRATSAAMSAILGNSDSIYLNPYDVHLEEKDRRSSRLARNIQFILREESYLNMVADPAGGSWFIEDITNKISDKAWELFQNIESEGGYLKAKSKGLIDSMLNQDSQELIDGHKSGKYTWIGVNKHPQKEIISRKRQSDQEGLGDLESILLDLKMEGKK